VKVVIPPVPGRKWGFRNEKYAKIGLIEISAFG